MKPLDSLFNLIRSLTPSEKRHFKIYADRYESKNNYSKLFDVFEKLPTDKSYDEDDVKRTLRGKSFGKNLAVEKKQLYDQILISMRSFHSGKTPEIKLLESFIDLRFLFEKGLFDEARKELNKGFEFAEETENLTAQIALHGFRNRLTRITQSKEDFKQAEDNFQEEKAVLRSLEMERRIVHLRQRTFYLYTINQLKNEAQEIKLEIENLTTKSNETKLTYQARGSLLVTQALIYDREGKFIEAMKFYEELLKLRENNKQALWFEKNIRTILRNYAVCALMSERWEVVPGIFNEIEMLPCENVADEVETFNSTKMLGLVYLINSPDKSNADVAIEAVEAGLKKYASLISKTEAIHARENICLLYFFLRRYDEVISSLNIAYTLIGRDEKFDPVLKLLKFYELMSLISLDNRDLLDYQAANTERWLREHQLNNECTNLMVKLLRKWDIRQAKQAIDELTNCECPPDTQILRYIVLEWMKVF